jgi:Glycosyltransferase 61
MTGSFEFTGVPSADLVDTVDLTAFPSADSARVVVAPAGSMAMPDYRVTNRDPGGYRVAHYNLVSPGGTFPSVVDFPDMAITQVKDAYCLPFGPPALPSAGKIITDYINRWEDVPAIGFSHVGGNVYRTTVDFTHADVEYDLDTACYLDAAISKHFGHFIIDCLSRVYALDACRSLFGDIKLIMGCQEKTGFQIPLLEAAGIPSRDVIKTRHLVHCRRLLMVTPSVRLGRYASPTAVQLWTAIRDRVAARNPQFPNRIYLSRRAVDQRKLVNEAAVEQIFERHGFVIIRPEAFDVRAQIALLANAVLVAGPSGSALFNMAFQGRMKSAFILVWAEFIQVSEMLMAAGQDVDLWYHLGVRIPRGPDDPWGSWTVDLPRLESDVADWVAQRDP